MSEYDEDIDDDGNADESTLLRDLRKQLKAAKKEKDERDAELARFRADQRKASVADVLKERGARPELAKFYTGEDSSKEAVASWIEENADLFGISRDGDEPDPAVAAAASAISRATAEAPQVKIGSIPDLFQRVANAKTRDELEAAYKAAGMAAA
jgi:hypothetical protein